MSTPVRSTTTMMPMPVHTHIALAHLSMLPTMRTQWRRQKAPASTWTWTWPSASARTSGHIFVPGPNVSAEVNRRTGGISRPRTRPGTGTGIKVRSGIGWRALVVEVISSPTTSISPSATSAAGVGTEMWTARPGSGGAPLSWRSEPWSAVHHWRMTRHLLRWVAWSWARTKTRTRTRHGRTWKIGHRHWWGDDFAFVFALVVFVGRGVFG